MKNKNILVVCSTRRDRVELKYDHVRGDNNIYWYNYDLSSDKRIMCRGIWLSELFDSRAITNQLTHLVSTHQIDGIIASQDYPGSIFASIAAQKSGLIGPDPQALLVCHHKYYSRCAQSKYVPEATPMFTLIDPQHIKSGIKNISFPVFVKPVKSSFSIFANQANTVADLEKHVKMSVLPKVFVDQFDCFLQQYMPGDSHAHCLLVEECLQGVQTTLEGYVFDGEVTIFGVTDSIMVPGTISFKRFEYPSSLSEQVQKKMENTGSTFMRGIGFDNGLFNIEFMYNPQNDRVDIIEVNPRMSSQFADLYEKVDGVNSYRVLLDIAVGRKPVFLHRKGKYNVATSFVLRQFEDKHVKISPSEDDIEQFYKTFPDGRLELTVKAGDRLSGVEQDGKTYRYGLIHLGARDRKEIFEKYERAKQLLPFVFAAVDN